MIYRDFEREAREARERIRCVTQGVIEVVGADGPMDLEEAVTKALNELRGLRSIVREVYRAIGCEVPPDDTWGELPSRVACMRAALDLAKAEAAFEVATLSQENADRVDRVLSMLDEEGPSTTEDRVAPLDYLRDEFRSRFSTERLHADLERMIQSEFPEAVSAQVKPMEMRNGPSGVYITVFVKLGLPISLFSLPDTRDEWELLEWVEGEGEKAFCDEVSSYSERLAGHLLDSWDVQFETGSEHLVLMFDHTYWWN
jgi:hypothetical protein